MKSPLCSSWQGVSTPIIGMLHAPPLPGSPRWNGTMTQAIDHVLRDGNRLVEGGVHGLMIENFGDAPFFAGRVPAETVAALTCLATAIRRGFPNIPLGINVLRNDVRSALAIAVAVGASYVRVNVLCGSAATDQGIISGEAAEVLRYRDTIGGGNVRILADVRVKHARPLVDRPLTDEVAELVERALADAVIVTGSGTGQPIDIDELRAVSAVAGHAHVLVGSGVTAQTIPTLREFADGFIVGSSLKEKGELLAPVDKHRVNKLTEALA